VAAASGADLIILCTPIEVMEKIAAAIPLIWQANPRH